MLTSTFCHIPGVGERTERDLWAAGLTSWDAARCGAVRADWAGYLDESLFHYRCRQAGYFAGRLRASQHWRLYRDFQDCCAFLDIETTGLAETDAITTVALYDGRTVRTYVRGANLDRFAADVGAYRLLVTYNGKCFDVPFLERHFGLRLTQAHIDLRYPLRALGLAGGQKGCERRLGIGRPGLEDIDGYLAVLLWHDYRRGNARALETLLAYNVQDAVNLQALMVYAYNAKVQDTPFAASHRLPPCPPPALPFQADRETVARLSRGRRPFPARGA
jgi:uncharacterized protein YprB with RNaseH-like and TPR domain